MSSTAGMTFRLGNMVGMSSMDVNSDTSNTLHRPGSISFLVDAYGYPRIFKYVKNKRGSALTYGMVNTRPVNVAITNMTSASTATQLVTTGLTASAHDGKLIYIQGETAATAPDGEVSIVKSNTATLVNLEAGYALSTATVSPTGTADAVIVSNWQTNINGTSDLAINVQGAIAGVDGISDGNFGWVQVEGPSVVNQTTVALTSGGVIETSATAGAVQVGGSGTQETWIGWTMATSITNATKALVYLKLFTTAGPFGTP